jgi:myosin heavy subunit
LIKEIIAYLKTSAAKHVLGIAVAVFVVIAFRSYMSEHDARIQAEATIKQSQTAIADLQKQKQEVQDAKDETIAALEKQKAEVKTVPQAIAALPSVSTVPLNAAPLPDAPSKVAVDAVPLFQELNQCRQCDASLSADDKQLALDKEISAEKDTEIQALKKKPAFWSRVKKTGEVLAIGAAIGYVSHR